MDNFSNDFSNFINMHAMALANDASPKEAAALVNQMKSGNFSAEPTSDNVKQALSSLRDSSPVHTAINDEPVEVTKPQTNGIIFDPASNVTRYSSGPNAGKVVGVGNLTNSQQTVYQGETAPLGSFGIDPTTLRGMKDSPYPNEQFSPTDTAGIYADSKGNKYSLVTNDMKQVIGVNSVPGADNASIDNYYKNNPNDVSLKSTVGVPNQNPWTQAGQGFVQGMRGVADNIPNLLSYTKNSALQHLSSDELVKSLIADQTNKSSLPYGVGKFAGVVLPTVAATAATGGLADALLPEASGAVFGGNNLYNAGIDMSDGRYLIPQMGGSSAQGALAGGLSANPYHKSLASGVGNGAIGGLLLGGAVPMAGIAGRNALLNNWDNLGPAVGNNPFLNSTMGTGLTILDPINQNNSQ